ncbi:MAG: hypothetical protein AB1762_13510 [Gemmatimonadota bacterium]
MSETVEGRDAPLEQSRAEELQSVRKEAENRLSDRRIPVTPSDSDEDVANILEAVEQFESTVEALGGDLMVNRIGVREPQDPAFVPPQREDNEAAGRYSERLIAATHELRRRGTAD